MGAELFEKFGLSVKQLSMVCCQTGKVYQIRYHRVLS